MLDVVKVDTLSGRISRAISMAGLTTGQCARKLQKGLLTIGGWRDGSELPSIDEIAQLACLVDVDPRWLARGLISPAATNALDQFRRAVKGTKVSAVDRATLEELLSMTAEPDQLPGVCKYCGCTDEHGCGDCEWIDECCTICSACLEEEN